MEFLKKEIYTLKSIITNVLNQNNNNILPITKYDIITKPDKTLYCIKIEK